jgi:ribosomal-protein-alanine N-acetyltransferase
MSRGWPATLREGRVALRPIARSDREAWTSVRALNRDWLAPWEATPPVDAGPPMSFAAMVRNLRSQARAGTLLPFVLTLDGALVGQLTVGGITYGSLCSGHVGYWIDARVAGRGVMPTAVALAVDHCFQALRLHRVEVNIRPENSASLRVVEKLGFRDEGYRPRFLHINGQWADHRSFALTSEEVPEGLLSTWLRTRPA